MSLEFAIQHHCPLRVQHTEAQLRAWGKLFNLHTRLKASEDSLPTAEKARFIAEAAADLRQIEDKSSICRYCPASLPRAIAGFGEAFGCQGRITYPIEAHFEKFLADRVQLALDTIDLGQQPHLLHVLLLPDSPFDGTATQELRHFAGLNGVRFFALSVPIQLTRQARHINTDNIFDLLTGFHSEISAATSYARELPFAAVADYRAFLHLMLRHEVSPSERARLYQRGPNYMQYLRLLEALERAQELRNRILLD